MSSTPIDRLPVAGLPDTAEAPQASKVGKSTYSQILKSTALVGGSTVLSMAIGMVRTKAMAMLLGPAGFGLAGMYLSIASLAQSLAGIGVSSSGVREIGEPGERKT